MKVIKEELKHCPICMEEHNVALIEIDEENIYKGQVVRCVATHEYCNKTDRMFDSEYLLDKNFAAIKDAFDKMSNPQQVRCASENDDEIPYVDILKALHAYDNSSPKMDELTFVDMLQKKYNQNRKTVINKIREVRKEEARKKRENCEKDN